MEFVVWAIATCVACRLYLIIHNHFFTDGEITVDMSNPDKDVYQLQLESLEVLETKKRIIFKISHK